MKTKESEWAAHLAIRNNSSVCRTCHQNNLSRESILHELAVTHLSPSAAQMSPASDSTLEVTWHQYYAIGEGKLGVELERICLAIFAYQSDWGLLTAFLDTVRETEYIILSRPNHSSIFQNHPILVAAPSLQKQHYKHDESRRGNICPGRDLQ